MVDSSHNLTVDSLPADRTYLPFLVNMTEHTSSPLCAEEKVEMFCEETPSHTLMLPSREQVT